MPSLQSAERWNGSVSRVSVVNLEILMDEETVPVSCGNHASGGQSLVEKACQISLLKRTASLLLAPFNKKPARNGMTFKLFIHENGQTSTLDDTGKMGRVSKMFATTTAVVMVVEVESQGATGIT